MEFNFDNGGFYGSPSPTGLRSGRGKLRTGRPLRFRSSAPSYFPSFADDGFGAVDVICILLIAAAVVYAVICWDTVSDYLFFSIIMPIIDILTKLIGIVLTGAVCYGFITRKVRKHKREKHFFGGII